MSQAHCAHEKLIVLVKSERKITSEILESLNQMNQQRHWAKLGFASLFEYCTKALGYSESQAYRRISAMKLLDAIPEVKQKIENAEVNLSTLAQAQSFIQKEERLNQCRFSPEEKSKIIERVELKTQREAELSLVEIASEPSLIKSHERLRAISKNHSQLQVDLSHETLSELEEIKNELSHCLKTGSYSEIISYLSQDFLKKSKLRKTGRLNSRTPNSKEPKSKELKLREPISRDPNSIPAKIHGSGASPLRRNVAAKKATIQSYQNRNSGSDTKDSLTRNSRLSTIDPQTRKAQFSKSQSFEDSVHGSGTQTSNSQTPARTVQVPEVQTFAAQTFIGPQEPGESPNPFAKRRRLTAGIRRQIWLKDGGRCSYKDNLTGRSCTSGFRLEIDHRIPRAQGGSDHPSNLRLLCKAHNQQQALEKLGREVMKHYL